MTDRAIVFNPLIVPGHTGEDTCHQVSQVLAFLASAALMDEKGCELLNSTGAAIGLALILKTCQAALDFHANKDDVGGAL